MSDIESRNLDNAEIVNAAIFEKTQFLFKTRKKTNRLERSFFF